MTFGAALLALSLQGSAAAATPPPVTIVVQKEERRLYLYQGGLLAGAFPIRLGQNPVGDKTRQGDSRTPEGRYVIDGRNENSAYFRGLHLSYPDAAHRKAAHDAGVDPGGDIVIHGLPNDWPFFYPVHLAFDWTDGCIALSNADMKTLWAAVPLGTPVEIRP